MQLQTLGRKLAYFNGYEPQQSVYLYAATGTTRDYGYGELGRATYVFEVGTSFFQDCASFAQTVLPGNLAALRYALKVVRTPYLTPAGPDAVGVTTSAGSPTTAVPAGTAVTLSATVTDTRYNTRNGTEASQPIAGGEYYVDVPPWGENPTGQRPDSNRRHLGHQERGGQRVDRYDRLE